MTGLVILAPLLAAAIFTPDAYSKNWVQNNSAGWNRGAVGPVPEKFDLRKSRAPYAAARPGAGAPTADVEQDWGPYTLEDFQQVFARNSSGDYLIDVVRIFYTAGEEDVQRVVEGLPIETLGQVMPESVGNPDGHRVRLFRLMMNCCIADARPVSIPVDFGSAVPEYEEMGWYKFKGSLAYEKREGYTIPVLHATRMEPVGSPEQVTMDRR